MRTRSNTVTANAVATLALVAILGLLGGCKMLAPSHIPEMEFFVLDDDITAPAALAAGTLILTVNPPRAAAGFDSPRIVYVRHQHQLEYFAHSAWVDSPADMLAPLLVRAIARGGAFRASLSPGSTARSDLQMEVEIVRLQQEFDGLPSRVRLTLRVGLVASADRQVLATREFESVVASRSEDARGGVAAANLAARQLLADIGGWSDTLAQQWRNRPGQRQSKP